uniref:Helix-turn-helix domain-containing protein n=1 Tax=Xenopus tropicalis TaxID=8364 RepID=A0A803JPC3_XENTR
MGGSVVVMDATTYENEVMRQLLDESTYIPLASDPTQRFQKQLGDLLLEGFGMGILDKKEFEYINCIHPVVPIFHILPKVHKSLENVTGRPIVAGIGALNEGLSQYVDRLLIPLVLRLPTFLKDTTMCINKLADLEWKPTYRWFTMDVTALYSSIDHTVGLDSIFYWLNRGETFSTTQIGFIMQSVDFLLHTNYFLFNGSFYLQRRGAAMGASFAPTYANLFMGWWERLHVFGELNKFCGQIVRFYRYIDDCIGVWEGDELSLRQFVEYCNGTVEGIKFTFETDLVKIPFLDVIFYIEGKKVMTDLFRKPITRNTILHAESGHPQSCVRGIPVGQFLRLRRICSSWDAFQEQAMLMWDRFLERGYNTVDIKRAYDKAVAASREDLLNYKYKNRNTKVMSDGTNEQKYQLRPKYCTTYGRGVFDIKRSICRHWDVLLQDPVLSRVLDKKPLFVFRKGRNIASWVSRSLFSTERNEQGTAWLRHKGTFKCGRNRCKACSVINVSKSFTSSNTGRVYQIPQYFNCQTKGIIYLATCCCGAQYVGQTIRAAGTRFLEHLSAIDRNDKRSAIAKHIIEIHASRGTVSFQVIDRPRWNERRGDFGAKLSEREVYWIYHLRTVEQYGGLNREWEVSCFY